MAWDFSTELFEKKLEWIREFVRAELEPLEVPFPGCEPPANGVAAARATYGVLIGRVSAYPMRDG
jgi:hypothetical protein